MGSSIDNPKVYIDAQGVNSSESGREERPSPQVSKSALVSMVIIVVVLALVSLFANVQRLRRDKIETVIVTPAPSPSPIIP